MTNSYVLLLNAIYHTPITSKKCTSKHVKVKEINHGFHRFYGLNWPRMNTKKHKVAEIARKVGLVFQDPEWQIFSLTVEDEIEFGIKNLGLSGTKKRVTNALELVGLKGYENREPHRLSQGQKQKLCVASVIATDPEVIVLDEPTSQLDYKNTKNIHEILKKLNKKGKTVILIEHDTDFLAEYCDRILIMDDGKIIRDDPTKKIFSQVNFLKKLGVKVPKR